VDHPLTIALVEDNPDHAILAAEALEARGHSVVHFARAKEAIAACQSRSWDALVLDYRLPDMTGLELLEEITDMPSAPPAVMITASGSEGVAVAALKKGACDYVVKTGRHGPELARAVELAVAKHHLEHMSHLYQQELERQAKSDPLTGLLNRRCLADQLGMTALRASRRQEPYAVALIDVDHFKQINDTRGHAVGDAVLVEFANILRACFRGRDTIARYGGDEFVIIMPRATQACLHSIHRRLQRALQQSPLARRLKLSLSASVGIADSSAGDAEQVLKAADRSMYHNKTNRR
jgi:diguanylate cyclase (GGDEF)-like protein